MRYTLTLHSENNAVLGTGRNFQSNFSIKSMDNLFRAKERLGQFDFQIHYQVVPFFAQIRMLANMDFHIQVAWHTALENLSLTVETNHLTVVDAGRHTD